MNDLKTRGVSDILAAVVDGLMPDPKATCRAESADAALDRLAISARSRVDDLRRRSAR